MAASTLASAGNLEKMLGDLKKLPLLTATAQQAMTLASEDSTNLKKFSRLVEKDVTLAVSFLKLANSPCFNCGHTIHSLDQAVVRIGLRECQNLMVAVSMRNLFQQTDPVTKAHCAVLWHHSYLTACLCRRLSEEFGFKHHGEDFTAGLLHDLGRILLAVTMPEQFSAADPMDFVEDAQMLDRERQLLGTDHCKVGTLYAKQNQLPPSAIAAIEFHHRPDRASDHRVIVELVVSADHMANFLQRGDKPDAYDLDQNPGFQSLAKGWTPERVRAFKHLTPRLIEETTQTAVQQGAPAKATASPVPVPKPVSPPAAIPKESVWNGLRSWLLE